MALHVVEEALQGGKACRASDQAAVQTNRQHLGRIQTGRVTLPVQHVEGILEVIKKLGTRIETLHRGEAHVIGVECVRHHQMRLRLAMGLNLDPIGQIVRVGVGVIYEAAMLDHQAPRVGTVAPGVPALRRGTGHGAKLIHRFNQMRTLGGFVHHLIRNPAQAVAGNFVSTFEHRRHRLGVALHRHRNAKHRDRHAPRLELAHQTPETGARAVFVNRFHRQVAVRKRLCTNDLGEKGLGSGIAMQHIVLTTLFIIEHELQGDACAIGPGCVGWLFAVAMQIARVSAVVHDEASVVTKGSLALPNWRCRTGSSMVPIQRAGAGDRKSSKVRATTLVARRKSSRSRFSSARLAFDSGTLRGPAP